MPSLSGMGGLPQLSMPGFGDLSMPSMGQMSMQGMQAQTAQTAKQSQAATTAAKMSATTTTSSELAEQEFFVPLRHIGRVITFPFLMWSHLVRRHLLTTFCGLYFSHHITHKLQATNSRWTSVCSSHVLLSYTCALSCGCNNNSNHFGQAGPTYCYRAIFGAVNTFYLHSKTF